MNRERGQAFILALILLGIGALLIIPFMLTVSTVLKSREMYGQFIMEDYAADAAVEYGMWRLKHEPGFAESLPIGTESAPFFVTLNGITANTTVMAQALEFELSGQALAGRAEDELFFKVEKTVVATATYATLAADNFENFWCGSGSCGTGSWIGNWNLSGSYSFTTSGEHEGERCLLLVGDSDGTPGDGYAEREVNLSGSTGLGPYLSFWARIREFENYNNDEAYVKVSTDGENWDILRTFTEDDNDDQYSQYQYDLSGYGTPSSFYVAFETSLSSSQDYFYIDDVKFINTEETTTILPGVETLYTYNVSIQCMDPDGCTLDRIVDELPERGASSGDYLQYVNGSTDWDVVAYDSFAFDGFETGGSTGSWIGSWTLTGDSSITTDNEWEGDRCLRLRGASGTSDGYAQRAVDLSGSTGSGPYLYFWSRIDEIESGDTIDVRVSTNGVDWDVLETFDYHDEDYHYHQHWYDLSGYGRPSTLYVSFKMNGSHDSDTFLVDAVEFSTYQGATSGEWPVPPFDPTDIDTEGSYSGLHQVLEWDFEYGGYYDIAFDYGETRTMNFQAEAALTEGTYCNHIWVSNSSSGDEGEIISGTTAKIIVGDPEETNCDGGLIEVNKVSDPEIVYPYEETTVNYTITIENVDTEDVTIYAVEDWLPATGSLLSEEGFMYVDNSASGRIIGRDSYPVLFYDPFNRPDSNTVSYWTDSDGSGSNVAIDDESVRLRIPPGTYDGNQFRVTGTSSIGSMNDNSPNYKSSIRFTAQSNQTVTRIRVYLETEAGTSPTYRYGLRANSSGNPSSNWLGASQQGYGDLTATTTGWQTITLNEPVSLNAGTTYHIVVQYQSGTINSSNYIALRRSTSQNQMLPYDGAADSNSNTLWYNGYSWSTQNYQPIYLLETDTSAYEGNPCETYTNQSVYGVNYAGELLTISGGDKQVTNIGFYVRENSSTDPNDHLYYQIRDSSNTVLRSGTLVAKTAITTSYNWYDASLSSSLTMINGATYRVNLYSTNSNSSYYYQVLRNDNTDAAAYNGRNYNGTSSVYCSSTNGGSSWTDSNPYDIPFRLTTIPDVSITKDNISTTGYSDIALSYSYWRGGSSGTNPQLKVEWKLSSSGTWNTLVTHTLTSSSPTTPSWTLPAQANDTVIDIRFTDLTVSTYEARVDNVKIISNIATSITPVCMPDDNDGTDFFSERWDGDDYWENGQYRWVITWDFDDYPDNDDYVWNPEELCEGYVYADYNPYLLLHPGEIFEITFQATGILTYSGSYFNEVFVKIYEADDYWDDDEWIYSWPTGTVIVPQYDLEATTLNSVLRANALLSPVGHWWRSWHWWSHR